MIRRRTLEITLEKLAKPSEPRPELEQYQTPSSIAADMLWVAHSSNDIQGKSVADLGCGSGILGIGAALLGANSVHCFDSDPKMVQLCRDNSAEVNAEIEVQCSDISDIAGKFDTVVQNPPFGAQKRGADRPFLEASLSISKIVYSLHLADTTDFVSGFCGSRGGHVEHIKNYKFEIPFMFEFHNKPVSIVDVALLKIISSR